MISQRLFLLSLALVLTVLGSAPAAADASCDRLFTRLRIAGTQLTGIHPIVTAFQFWVDTSWTTNYSVPAGDFRFTGVTRLNLKTQPNGDLFMSAGNTVLRTNTSLTPSMPSGTQPVQLRILANGSVTFNEQYGPYDPTCPTPFGKNDVFAIVQSGDSVEAFNFKPAGQMPATWLVHLPIAGMTLSANDVYFTTNEAVGPRLYRTAQTAVNGQEASFYGEPNDTRFGDVVVTTFNGAPHAFLWTQNGNGARIRRVHLADPNAPIPVVVGPVRNLDIAVSRRNLAANGEAIFWQDATRIRKLFFSGGAPVELAQTSATPRAGVHLHGETLYFADGNTVKSVSTNGGTVTTVATSNTAMLSITPATNGVYWGDASGAIVGRINGNPVTVRPSGPSNATSLTFDGTRVAATQCTSANLCTVFVPTFGGPGIDVAFAAGRNAHLLMINHQAKPFWGDETGLRRFP